MKTHSTLSMKDHPLKTYIDAVRDDAPESSQADAAQRRLMQRLGEAPQNKPVRVAPWGWATAAALAILMVPLLVMMPGGNGSLAFAEVQSFFTDFRTMQARLTTSMNGNEVMAMDIAVDDQDRARIDSGELVSLIVDPERQVMLQLFHGARRAVRVPLTDDGTQAEAPALDWLEQIREYQGEARLVEETRRIDGREVFGFRLTERAIDMTLWATESGRPVLLEMQTGNEAAPVTTRIRFAFDGPVDPERFSLEVPVGYSVETQLEDG